MRRFAVREFRWPSGIAEKVITKHGLLPEEVEESFFAPDARVRRTKEGRYLLLTRAPGGGYIIVVFAFSDGVATIITARRMSDAERRLFKRK